MLKDNKINYLTNNYRIQMFDLYYYELNNLVSKNTTLNIINKLKKNFYLIHKKKEKKKIFNIYLRSGDRKINKKDFSIMSNMFKIIYKLININNFDINIISAGNLKDINIIKNEYKLYNVNFLFNKKNNIFSIY